MRVTSMYRCSTQRHDSKLPALHVANKQRPDVGILLAYPKLLTKIFKIRRSRIHVPGLARPTHLTPILQ